MKDIVKICQKCGPLELSETYPRKSRFFCKNCTKANNKNTYERNKLSRLEKASQYRKENQEKLMLWQRDYRKQKKDVESELQRTKKRGYTKRFKEVLRKRNLTKKQYDDMLLRQQNKCAICKESETCKDPKNDHVRRLSIDHCHATKKTRGLLCHKCNLLIAYAKERHDIFKNASSYIKKWAKKHGEGEVS